MPRKAKASAIGAANILRKSGHSSEILSFSDFANVESHDNEIKSRKRNRFEPRATLDFSDDVFLYSPDFANRIDSAFKLLSKKDLKTKMKGLRDIMSCLQKISKDSSNEIKVIRSTVSHWLFLFDNFFYENDHNIRKDAVKIINFYVTLIPKAMMKCIDHWLFQVLLFAGDGKKEVLNTALALYIKFSDHKIEDFQKRLLLLLNKSSWDRGSHKDQKSVEERSLRLKSTFFRSFQYHYLKTNPAERSNLLQIFHHSVVQRLFAEKDIKIRLSVYAVFSVLKIEDDDELLDFVKHFVKFFVKEVDKLCFPLLWNSLITFIIYHKGRFWQEFSKISYKKSFFPALYKHVDNNMYSSKCYNEFIYFIATMPQSIFDSYQNDIGGNDLVESLFERIGNLVQIFPKKDLLLIVCLTLIKKYFSFKVFKSTEKLIDYLTMFLKLFVLVDIKTPKPIIEIFCIVLNEYTTEFRSIIKAFNAILPTSNLSSHVLIIHSLVSLNMKNDIACEEFTATEDIVYDRISSILQKSRQSDRELEELQLIVSLLAKNKYFFNNPVKKQFIVDIYYGIIGTCYCKNRVQIMLTTLEFLLGLNDIVKNMINLAKSYNRAMFLITCLISYLDAKNKLNIARKCCLYFLPKVISKTPSNDEFNEAIDLFLLLPERIIVKCILPEVCWILIRFVAQSFGQEFLILPKGHITNNYEELSFNRCAYLLAGILRRKNLQKSVKEFLEDVNYQLALFIVESSLLGGDIDLFFEFTKARMEVIEFPSKKYDENIEDVLSTFLFTNPRQAAGFLLIRGTINYVDVIRPIFDQLGEGTRYVFETAFRIYYKASQSDLLSLEFIQILVTVKHGVEFYLRCASDPIRAVCDFASEFMSCEILYQVIVRLVHHYLTEVTDDLRIDIFRLSDFISRVKRLEDVDVDFTPQVVYTLNFIEQLDGKEQLEIASDLFCAFSLHQTNFPLENDIRTLFVAPSSDFIDSLSSSVKHVINKSWSIEKLNSTDAIKVLHRKIENLGFLDFEVANEVCFQTEHNSYFIGKIEEVVDSAATNFLVKRDHSSQTFLVPLNRMQHAHKKGQYVLYLKNMSLIQIMIAVVENRIMHDSSDPPYYNIRLLGSIKFEDIFEGIDIELISEYDSEIQTLGDLLAPIPSYLIDKPNKSNEYKKKLKELGVKLAEKRKQKDIYGTRALMLEQQELIRKNRTISTEERKQEISKRRELAAKRKFLRQKAENSEINTEADKTVDNVDFRLSVVEKEQLLENLRKGSLLSFFLDTKEFQDALYVALQAFLTFYEQFEFDEISYLQFATIAFSAFKKDNLSYLQSIALNDNMPLIVERYVTEGGASKKISLITSRAVSHMLENGISIKSHWVDALCYFSIRVLCSLIDNSGLEESMQAFQICTKLPALFRKYGWNLDLDGDVLFEGFSGFMPRMHLIGPNPCLILAIFFGEYFGYHSVENEALFTELQSLLKELSGDVDSFQDYKVLANVVILVKGFKGLLYPMHKNANSQDKVHKDRIFKFLARNDYVGICLVSLFRLLLSFENYNSIENFDSEDEVQIYLSSERPVESDFIVRYTGFVIAELLSAAPSFARKWLLHIPVKIFTSGEETAIKTFIKTHISPTLIHNEFQNIRNAVAKGVLREYEEFDELALNDIEETDELSIIIKEQINIISIIFKKDESSLELDLKIEQEFPINGFDIVVKKQMGINTRKINLWKLQLLTLLNNRVGSLVDGVEAIRDNVKEEFSGIEPCVICYMVINMSDNSIPKFVCPTCKNKFHHQCLQKWHKTQNNKVCPVCKQAL